jgi:hypothetical protein
MDTNRHSNRQFPIKVVDELYDTYDFVNSFIVANGTSDYDLKTQQAAAFKNLSRAWLVIIWTDQDLSIKFNSSSNPAIAIPMVNSPMEFRNILQVSNIYITNASGSAANIKVMLV